ncbi:unnamed protein product [Aphanomyces euteiches]
MACSIDTKFFSQARVFQDITKPIVATEDLAAGQTIFQEIAIVSSGFGHSFDDCGCHGDDEPVEAHVEPETLDEDDLETVSPAVVQEFDALMSYCEGHPVLSMVDIRKNLFKLLRLYELDATSLTLLLTLEINKEEASEYLEAATGLRREHPSIIPPGLSDDDVAHLIGLLNNKYCHALEELSSQLQFDRDWQYNVARDGTWLNSNDAKDVALDEDGNLQHYKEMGPTHFINRYFKATDLAEKRIHVMVVVPDGQFGRATCKLSNEEHGEIVKIVHKVMRDSAEKVSVHSLSNMDSLMKQRILNKMVLKVAVLEMEEPRDTSIPGYPWIEDYFENQEGPRAQYMTYLETHLMTLLDTFSLQDIASEKSALDTKDPRLPLLLKGIADVLLVDKSMFTDLVPLSGLCLVMNVKKKIERKYVNQAIGQLVCARSRYRSTVIR